MLAHKTVGQQIAAKMGYSLLAGALLWVLLLVQGAQTLEGQPDNAHYVITFGPLKLLELTKHALDTGFKVTFTFESGMYWYLLFWLAAGLVVALLFIRPSSQRHNEDR